ncbi:Aim13 protein [Candida orthopsilosis Co 90-125]|uniref:Aim13 protein n=1 Tax=Candida orthopsilosis (strain 90-125) TaxID=1136231 RepID=H8X1K6_CANO9|nr:Aim13 protein [Candida orthopsilosis Co 90-125]CCG22411.1 Aim13 protein [Candida orthopsilosis Co 90-125]
MGSNTSKPETKVFTPTTPVDFSSTFLSQLEQSPESDYSRAQYTEKYIQDRVAEELQKLETQTIKQFKQTTNDAINKDSNSSKSKLSVIESNAKIAKLTKLLQDNAKLEQVNITPELKDSRDKVIACLKDNQGKSLNCWDEVETFKTLVRNL